MNKVCAALSRRTFVKLACAFPLAARFARAVAFHADRHWRVFVFNISHLDVGWQALPDVIRVRIAGFIDDTVRLCDSSKAQPETERYKFSIEHSWVVDYYERHRSPAQFNRLVDCIRRGQIEVGALYTAVHTDLCGHEELVRLTSLAGALRRRLQLPIRTAILDDVGESYTMGLAQVLPKSGIEYFCMGPGGKAAIRGITPHIPRIFRWTAKDGSSVLVGWTPGLWTYGVWSAGYKGDSTLEEFQNLPDYPYDVLFRQGGGTGDIASPDPKLLDLIKSYQTESPEALIELSTATEFFDALSHRYSKDIPDLGGDCADSWADGVIALAHETGIHRRTQAALIRAEILMTMAGHDQRPTIRDAYCNLQLYSDHTWGLDFDPDNRPGLIRKFTRAIGGGKPDAVVTIPAGQTLGPGSPAMKVYEASWDAKKQYVYRAEKSTTQVLEQALRTLNERVAGAEDRVAVWNTLSWTRSGLIRFTAPDGKEIKSVRDRSTGRSKPVQYDLWNGEKCCVFLADDVPPFGCRVYDVEFGPTARTRVQQGTLPGPGVPGQYQPVPPTQSQVGVSLDNGRYRIELDAEAASIRSIYDRQLARYVQDPSANYAVGQYIYDNVNDFYSGGGMSKAGYAFGPGLRFVPEPDGAPFVESGPVFSTLNWNSKIEGVPAAAQLKSRILLSSELPHVAMQSWVDKRAAMEKEQIYFAFPFDVGPSPKFTLELAYALLDWDRDILPGSWRGYSCYRNFVRVMGQNAGVTWSSLDAPVVSVGGINSNRWDPHWHDTYCPDNAHIYSYIMSNIWDCNYPLYQGGRSRFDYAFLSHGPQFSPAQSFRFGWETNHPLEARFCPGGTAAVAAGNSVFIRTVEPDNVILSVLKPSDAGPGVVLRVFETAGTANTLARVQVGDQFRSARLVNLVEEDLGPAILRNGFVELQLRENELATVKLFV